MASYLLGLDAGNTVIKAVLFDTFGHQVGFYALDGATHKPAPGMVERSLPELWENARTTIRSCIDKTGVSAKDILAIGCAGHGNGLYLLDKSNQPLLGIQSLDSRAAKLAAELDRTDGAAVHAVSLQRPWPSQTPVLLTWIKRNRPDLYAKAGTVLFAKDVLTWNLTGCRVSEISDMSGAGLLKLPSGEYSPQLLALYGLEDAIGLLPKLMEPAQIAGHVTDAAAKVTGLAVGTPVIAGFFDVVASAMGSGAVRPGEASIVVGSWSINQVFSTSPVIDERVFMVSAFAPARFVNMENSATSAANLEWYVRTLVERGAHTGNSFNWVNDAVGRTKPSADDPLFHPFLYGARMGAHQRGGFYGLAGWHDEGHLLRALFEGVMFEHRRHIEVLASAGVTFEKAALSGGGTRSPHWPQMFADGLGVPVTIAECDETGALGAAMGAAIAVGLYPNYVTAVSGMTRSKSTFVPDATLRQHYDRRYAVWTRLTAAMDPFWLELRGD